MFEPTKSNIPNSKLKATMWQRILQNPFKASHTPGKINIEPENDGLEDDIFSRGPVFTGSMLIFWGLFV